jgi:hypothetical protein
MDLYLEQEKEPTVEGGKQQELQLLWYEGGESSVRKDDEMQ